MKYFWVVLVAMGVVVSPLVNAQKATIAVASNFTVPMKKLVAVFNKTHDHDIVLAFASSGKLFAQITHGAPYSAFFSADQDKPAKLIENGFAIAGSQYSYAVGVLALWSNKSAVDAQNAAVLTNGTFANQSYKLAIANPKFAPFGIAALEVLENLNLGGTQYPKLVKGENVAQTYQFVHSGNAQLGFVALSQLKAHLKQHSDESKDSIWIVPQSLHSPIIQDAVLLKPGEHNEAAQAFFDFVKSTQAKAIIQQAGYRSVAQ